MKVVFATPTMTRPHDAYLKALEDSVPHIKAAGWDEGTIFEVGCPYISHARATMTGKALDAGADVIVYIDHDLSWDPQDLVKLIQTEGDVVAGTYRYKKDEEHYMGAIIDGPDFRPQTREDGAILGHSVPAGFLKVTRHAIRVLMREYPELLFGDPEKPVPDLFNHGAYKGVWYGEDIAFSRRWRAIGGKIWVVPDLNLTHHGDKAYPGNLNTFLRKQPGGDLAPKESE